MWQNHDNNFDGFRDFNDALDWEPTARDNRTRAPRPSSIPTTQHRLIQVGMRNFCKVCRQTWTEKPEDTCVGQPMLKAVPNHLVTLDGLFREGLAPASGQQPVACTLDERQNPIPLYEHAASVPRRRRYSSDVPDFAFVDRPHAVEIHGAHGLSVTIWYHDTWFNLYSDGPDSISGYVLDNKFPLWGWQGMLSPIANWFACHLGLEGEIIDDLDAVARKLRHALYQAWKRIIEDDVPSEVSELARLMYLSTKGDAPILHDPELYTPAHAATRSELRKFHACRLFASRLYYSLERTVDWRAKMAPTLPNEALIKTLETLPYGIPPDLIPRLSTIQSVSYTHLTLPTIYSV